MPQPHPKVEQPGSNWRHQLHTIIFEADTRAGKIFDISLIGAILVSVGIIMLDSIPAVNEAYGRLLLTLEWIFTLLFTVEYILRLLAVRQPGRYARSFFGIIDLTGFLPSYLSLILGNVHATGTCQNCRTQKQHYSHSTHFHYLSGLAIKFTWSED